MSAAVFPEPPREAPEDSGLPLLVAEDHEEHRETRQDRGELPARLVDAVREIAENAVDSTVSLRYLPEVRERELPEALYELRGVIDGVLVLRDLVVKRGHEAEAVRDPEVKLLDRVPDSVVDGAGGVLEGLNRKVRVSRAPIPPEPRGAGGVLLRVPEALVKISVAVISPKAGVFSHSACTPQKRMRRFI